MHSGFKVLFIAFFQGIRGLFLCPYDHPGTISAASPCLQNSKRLSFTVPQDGMPGQPPLWGIWGGMCETFQLLLASFLRWSMLWYKELSAHEQTNRSSLIYIDGFCNSMKAHVEGLFPSSHCIQDLFLCCIKRERWIQKSLSSMIALNPKWERIKNLSCRSAWSQKPHAAQERTAIASKCQRRWSHHTSFGELSFLPLECTKADMVESADKCPF